MLRKSFEKYLTANVSELVSVQVSSADLVLSTLTLPFATVAYMSDKQLLWVIGDDARQENIYLQIGLFCRNLDEHMTLKNKVERVLESAQSIRESMRNGVRMTTANQLLYSSGIPNWDITYVPTVYKNGAIVASGYTVDYTAGTITFAGAQGVNDKISVTFQSPVLEPGIPLMGLYELLTTNSSHLVYHSVQAPWSPAVVPVVYKAGTVLATSAYTVNYSAGTITFATDQGTAEIRADYGAGVFDYTIEGISDTPIVDIANKTMSFCTFFTIMAFYYIRNKGQSLS